MDVLIIKHELIRHTHVLSIVTSVPLVNFLKLRLDRVPLPLGPTG